MTVKRYDFDCANHFNVIKCGVLMSFVELERAKAALKKARGEL